MELILFRLNFISELPSTGIGEFVPSGSNEPENQAGLAVAACGAGGTTL